jgi:hypothetical protein
MFKTVEMTDSNEKVIGTMDQHFQLCRKYAKNGDRVTPDGRTYKMVWTPKYVRNIQFK